MERAILFKFGSITLYWYGLCLWFGAWSALSYAHYLLSRTTVIAARLKPQIELIFFHTTWVGLVSGRLGAFLLYEPARLLADPLALFRISEGGMSFYGGVLGVVLFLLGYTAYFSLDCFAITDIIVQAFPIAIAFGRLGNILNGELWGRVTSVPWGYVYQARAAGTLRRHPSPCYELLLEGILLWSVLYKLRPRCTRPGELSALFLVFYALFRFAAEFFREPDPPYGLLWLNLTSGQWFALPMILGGIGYALLARQLEQKSTL